MSNSSISHSRQISAWETLIAIEEKRMSRPKPQQMQMLIQDAKAALETLRRTGDK